MKPSDGPNTQEIHEIPAIHSLVPCNSLVSKLILKKTAKDQGCLGIKGTTSPLYIFKISPHRWSSMVVGSKGWAERRYIREVKDVQGTSNKSQILKDIQKACSRSNTAGRNQCLQSQRRRFYASSACRGAIPRRLSSQRRRFYAPSWKCHIRRDFKDTVTSRRPPPPIRQNQNEDQTSPQRQERTVS